MPVTVHVIALRELLAIPKEDEWGRIGEADKSQHHPRDETPDDKRPPRHGPGEGGRREFRGSSPAGAVQVTENVNAGGRTPDREAQLVGLDPDAAEAQPEEPQLEARRENGHGRYDDDGREEPHEQLRRPSAAVRGIAGVIAHEAIAGGRHLQGHRWNDKKAQQEMLGQQTPDAKNSYCEKPKQDEKETTCERRQALIGGNARFGRFPIAIANLCQSSGFRFDVMASRGAASIRPRSIRLYQPGRGADAPFGGITGADRKHRPRTWAKTRTNDQNDWVQATPPESARCLCHPSDS